MDSFEDFDVAAFTADTLSSSAPPISIATPADTSMSLIHGSNPYLTEFTSLRASLLSKYPTLPTLFSPAHPPVLRGTIWTALSEAGEDLVNKYAWCIPNPLAINVLKNFQPIVEVGSGANCYWGNVASANGVDITCYDSNVTTGGKISDPDGNEIVQNVTPNKGGPEVLKSKQNKKKTLFLAFPDEFSELGFECLENYSGDYVIHCGELYGDTLSHDQGPYGRSSAPSLLNALGKDFHCILKAPLPAWPHENNSVSVWKRTDFITMVFEADEDIEGDEDEESGFCFIPEEERLKGVVVAECLEWLVKGEAKPAEKAEKEVAKEGKKEGKKLGKMEGKNEKSQKGEKSEKNEKKASKGEKEVVVEKKNKKNKKGGDKRGKN